MSRDGSQCVCKPGLHPVGGSCVPCPAGFMCPDGALVQCPRHYYQPSAGATSCLQCGSTGDDNGFYASCGRRGYMLRFCDPNHPGTQDRPLTSNCVPCNQCSRPYVFSSDPNMVECYRDN